MNKSFQKRFLLGALLYSLEFHRIKQEQAVFHCFNMKVLPPFRFRLYTARFD